MQWEGTPITINHCEITCREIQDGNIEICRNLCNALMEHQAERGTIHPEVLRAMSFGNRMKPSFESAAKKQVTIAFDGDKPVGYIFSTAAMETEASKTARPAWAAGLSGIQETGFYPDGMPTPQMVGCLNNLYVLPEYRGRHIAYTLCASAMQWFRGVPDIQSVFVYISNGNDSVISLYRNLGFRYSHDVFGGFILAYSMTL